MLELKTDEELKRWPDFSLPGEKRRRQKKSLWCHPVIKKGGNLEDLTAEVM